MKPADNEFFEEYKRLDKLCADIYSCRNGVSEYIADMEEKAHQGRRRVSSWDYDYKMLKHVRWVRSQLAHDSCVYQISEPGDLDFVRDFYERIFSGHDPLTLLRKAIKAETKGQQNRKMQNPPQPPTVSDIYIPPEEKTPRRVGFVIGMVVLAIILLIILLVVGPIRDAFDESRLFVSVDRLKFDFAGLYLHFASFN